MLNWVAPLNRHQESREWEFPLKRSDSSLNLAASHKPSRAIYWLFPVKQLWAVGGSCQDLWNLLMIIALIVNILAYFLVNSSWGIRHLHASTNSDTKHRQQDVNSSANVIYRHKIHTHLCLNIQVVTSTFHTAATFFPLQNLPGGPTVLNMLPFESHPERPSIYVSVIDRDIKELVRKMIRHIQTFVLFFISVMNLFIHISREWFHVILLHFPICNINGNVGSYTAISHNIKTAFLIQSWLFPCHQNSPALSGYLQEASEGDPMELALGHWQRILWFLWGLACLNFTPSLVWLRAVNVWDWIWLGFGKFRGFFRGYL